MRKNCIKTFLASVALACSFSIFATPISALAATNTTSASGFSTDYTLPGVFTNPIDPMNNVPENLIPSSAEIASLSNSGMRNETVSNALGTSESGSDSSSSSDASSDDGSSEAKLVSPVMDSTLDYLDKSFTPGEEELEQFEEQMDDISAFFSKDMVNNMIGDNGVQKIESAMIFAGAALCFVLFTINLVLVNMNYASDSNKSQSIRDLLIRFPITLIFIVNASSVINLIDKLCAAIYSYVKTNITFISFTFSPTAVLDNALGFILVGFVIVIKIMVFIEYIKILIELAERGFVIWGLSGAMPLACATYVSRTTSNIFSNYLRMYVNQWIMFILTSAVYMPIFQGLMGNVLRTGGLIYNIVLLALAKFIQKIDSYMKSLGLTVAQTGSGLLDSIVGAIGIMKGMTKSAGSAMAGIGTAAGNITMASAGNSIANVAKGDLSKVGKTAGLDAFQRAGGFGNAGLQNVATLNAAVDEAKKGNFRPLSSLPSGEVRDAAIREAIGDKRIAAIKKATGIDLNQTKNMSINPNNGAISGAGVVATKSGNGNVAFTAGLSAQGRNAKLVTVDVDPNSDEERPAPMYVSAQGDSTVIGCTTDNIGAMASITGADLSGAENSGLNIGTNVYCDNDGSGYIEHYSLEDDDGNTRLVGITDAETGEFYTIGMENTDGYSSTYVPFENYCDENGDVSSDGLLRNFNVGNNAHVTNVINEGNATYCTVESDSAIYEFEMSSPEKNIDKLIHDRKHIDVQRRKNSENLLDGDVCITAKRIKDKTKKKDEDD